LPRQQFLLFGGGRRERPSLVLIVRSGEQPPLGVTLGLLRQIRALPEAILRLAAAVDDVSTDMALRRPADERLEQLELSRAKWEAEIGALILKADSTYKSASNAESRARTMVRAYEKELDPFPEDGDEAEREVVREEHVEGGGENGVQAMYPYVAPSPKALALRAKWGV